MKTMKKPLWVEMIGSKVIILCNDGTPPHVGTYIGNDPNIGLPAYKDENGKEWITGGIVYPFNQKWLDFLQSFPDSKEVWSIMASHTSFRDYLRN